MTTKRRELISALIRAMKIEEDIFAIETVKECTENLKESQYLDFYQAVVSDESFGNGVKSILKISKKFKPSDAKDATREKAKELISLCESANSTVFDNSTKSGRTFDDEMKGTRFTSISKEDMIILENVKPFFNHKRLIAEIRTYENSEYAIRAFTYAINTKDYAATQIANTTRKLQIKRG